MAAPTLTPRTDDAPSPRVVIEFAGSAFPAGTERITILEGDREVPGAKNIGALGGVVSTDYAAPFQTPLSYRAACYNAAGVFIDYTEAASTVLNVNRTYMSSPANPKLSLAVELSASAASDVFRPVNGKVHNIGDRRILIASAMGGIEDLDMSFTTESMADYATALAIFRDAHGMVLFRTPPPILIPRVLYGWGAPHIKEVALANGIEEVDFELKIQEISAPTTQIVTPVLTYRRFLNAFGTYRAFRTSYATYRAALLNPPPEV